MFAPLCKKLRLIYWWESYPLGLKNLQGLKTNKKSKLTKQQNNTLKVTQNHIIFPIFGFVRTQKLSWDYIKLGLLSTSSCCFARELCLLLLNNHIFWFKNKKSCQLQIRWLQTTQIQTAFPIFLNFLISELNFQLYFASEIWAGNCLHTLSEKEIKRGIFHLGTEDLFGRHCDP